MQATVSYIYDPNEANTDAEREREREDEHVFQKNKKTIIRAEEDEAEEGEEADEEEAGNMVRHRTSSSFTLM
jgi:hypothetical protein